MSQPTPFSVAAIRRQFPLIDAQALVYLDNAATTQKPQCVIDALTAYYQGYNANVHRAAHHLSDLATRAFEQARARVKTFLNARDNDEIIWVRGATEGINLVAHSFGCRLQAGDEILISTLEHHANIVPWQLLAQRSGALIRPIPIDEQGDIDIAAYTALLSKRTKLVALTQVSNAIGTTTNLRPLIDLAHQIGAVTLVDGAQAVSHFPVDVQALNTDFYVFSGHKVFAPTGIGALYARKEVLASMPPWQGGGEMIERVSFENTTFNQPPFRFEAGTPDIGGAIALGAALDFLQSQDRSGIQQHEEQLLARATSHLHAIAGVTVVANPMRRTGVLPFIVEGWHTQDIGALLDQHKIAIRSGHHCAMPLMQRLQLTGCARASFALYNTLEEVDLFANALAHILSPLQVNVQQGITKGTTAQPSDPVNCGEDGPLFEQLAIKLRDCRSWEARYSMIMSLGRAHHGISSDARREEDLLHGCTSRVWLRHAVDIPTGQIRFEADSDAKVMRGLIVLVLALIENKTARQIVALDFNAQFERLGLLQHLSQSRSNGLHTLIAEIVRRAAQSATS